MKNCLLILSLLSLNASADTILNPGEMRVIGSERVYCMGSAPTPPPFAPLTFCAYNYSDPVWGIHMAKARTAEIARMRVLQICSDFNRQACNGIYVQCEQEPSDPWTTYTCQYSYPTYGTFIAEARSSLEATTEALKQCEQANRKDCNASFVTCVRN